MTGTFHSSLKNRILSLPSSKVKSEPCTSNGHHLSATDSSHEPDLDSDYHDDYHDYDAKFDTKSPLSHNPASNTDKKTESTRRYSHELTTTVLLPPLDMSVDEQRVLGYMPLRDDFEREYKNDAETLLSNLSIANNQLVFLASNCKALSNLSDLAHINSNGDHSSAEKANTANANPAATHANTFYGVNR